MEKTTIDFNNGRQMPKNLLNITQDKRYDDRLYGWLQINSVPINPLNPNDKHKCISYKKINFSQMEKEFTQNYIDEKGNQISKVIIGRKTLKKKFEYLIAMGLVIPNPDKKYYELLELEKQYSHLIELNTLTKLTQTLQDFCTSIYTYIFNEWYKNDKKPFITTIKQIKEYLGISTNTTSNNNKVTNCFEILFRLGLIKYQYLIKEEKTFFQFYDIKHKLPDINIPIIYYDQIDKHIEIPKTFSK